MNLILASGSPRRKQLLAEAGYEFTIHPPDESAEQVATSGFLPREVVAALAFQKAKFVASRHASGIILAADTVAECGGQILGKPVDMDHARLMLTLMSGQRHFVHTGVCLWSRPDDRQLMRTETTELYMREWSESRLQDYLHSGQWQGKAGAFGYQDDLDWVEIVRGSASNVVGLPMEILPGMLAALGR